MAPPDPFAPAPFARAVSPGGLQRSAQPSADAAVLVSLRGGGLAGFGPGVFAANLDVILMAGGIVAVVGATGAGKTLLFDALRLARPLAAGTLEAFGADVGRLNASGRARLRRRFGVSHQTPRLMDHLGVVDNIALPLRLAGRPESAYLDDVKDLIGYLGLDAVTDRPAAALSVGERRRTALARALIARPAVLFADAPLEGGSSQGHMRTQTLLQQIAKAGASVFVTAQTATEVERLATHCLRLDGGRLEAVW